MGISRSYIVLHLPPFMYSTYPLSRTLAPSPASFVRNPHTTFPSDCNLPPFPSRIAGRLWLKFA
jgi:hypothetical protein